jgi:hypothetical protein
MLPFSALSKTEAPETSRRMSRPDAGFATIPTVAGAPSLGSLGGVEELLQQAVRAGGGLHLRHVARNVQDLGASLGR